MADDARGAGEVARRVAEVRARIAVAARAAGRDPAGVTLVAATKTVPVEQIREALAAGIADLGENRAQELVAKAPKLIEHNPRWHFIGRLQRNKIHALAPWVTIWHTADRADLADPFGRIEPPPRVLVQVNVDDDPAKGGCHPGEIAAVVEALRQSSVDVVGLMTVPRFGPDPRWAFAFLRKLAVGLELAELSMGMTDDFEAAIAEGATLIRVGRALFGARA